MVERGNELKAIADEGEKLAEKNVLQKEELEEKNSQVLTFQHTFHESFEKVLTKRKSNGHFSSQTDTPFN